MKKWLTGDALANSFISAMGYGFGYSIPAALGAPGWLCLIVSIGVGMLAGSIAGKVMFSKSIQEKLSRKILVVAAFAAVFLIGNVISKKFFDKTLMGDLKQEYGFAIAFAVIGFVGNLAKYYIKVVKVKKKYGEGEEGFRFTDEEKAYMEGLNGKNAEFTGKADPALTAKTRTGVYVGVKEDSVLSFNGIPYAKAPVGALRWKAPEKLTDSDKVFEAKYFGASAIQVNYEGNLLCSHQQSEDCLTLNICTSELVPKEKKPVVVYFHGGDFSYGGSADPLWELASFVKAHPDVVAVSFNYRLGLLGFIDFSAVPGGKEYPDAANLGLLDQIAALEWVKENIAAFGGDAEQITVMGDSAGGTSISLLSVCKRVKGFFKKAILFSGTPYDAVLFGADSAALASELLKAAGASCMKELLALPESRLSELTQQLKAYMATPRCDGKLIPTDVFEAYNNGEAKDVSFILCTSRDIASVYSASVGRGFSESLITETNEKILKRQKPEAAQALRKQIGDKAQRVGKAKAEAEFFNLWMDNVSICYVSKLLLSGGGDARLLYWDVDAVIKNLGVGDVSLISTALGNSETAVAYGSVVNETIREILQALILKVVHGKAPELFNNELQGVNAIKWESYPSVLAVTKNRIQPQAAEDTLTDARQMLLAAGLEG